MDKIVFWNKFNLLDIVFCIDFYSFYPIVHFCILYRVEVTKNVNV